MLDRRRRFCIFFATVVALTASSLAALPSTSGESKALVAATRPVPIEGVTIDVTPVKVTTKTFDRKNPPAEMPPLKPGEAAVAESNFSCRTVTSVVVVDQNPSGGANGGANGTCAATVQVEKMSVTLGLEVVIWLPKGGPRKLTVHEEGHQKISEHFYALAEPIITALTAEQIGKTYTASADTCDAAIEAAISEAGNSVCEQYMAKVQMPSANVQERYDELTDHGRNRLGEDEAIRRAIEEETTKMKPDAASRS